MGLSWERILSPRFITSETYGTRSSTVLAVEETGKVHLLERSFNQGEPEKTRSYSFTIR